MAGSFLTNIYLWIGIGLFFMLVSLLSLILIILLGKRTHAIIEFKAWLSGKPICMFFREDRYVEWRPLKPDAGIIIDDDYGAYIVNERATYVDKKTKSIILPFDAAFGSGVNVHAAKLVDDLQYVVKDEEEFKKLRYAVSNGLIDENQSITSLKTTVFFGALKSMMTALIPHNINAKIEKVLASRMKGYGKVNVPQVLLIFAGMLGAILLGALIIKLAFGK